MARIARKLHPFTRGGWQGGVDASNHESLTDEATHAVERWLNES